MNMICSNIDRLLYLPSDKRQESPVLFFKQTSATVALVNSHLTHWNIDAANVACVLVLGVAQLINDRK